MTILEFYSFREDKVISSPESLRINHQIRAREVRLITDTNENMVVPLNVALKMAEERGLDLVEVSPTAEPPVVRIMDYGKFQFERQKRERKAKKQQKVIEVKEIQLLPKTDDYHLQFKVKDARRWLGEGMKVRVRIRFRGREITHSEIGRERLEKIANDLSDIAAVEQSPKMEGNTMLMILTPAAEKKKQ